MARLGSEGQMTAGGLTLASLTTVRGSVMAVAPQASRVVLEVTLCEAWMHQVGHQWPAGQRAGRDRMGRWVGARVMP